MIDRSWRKAAIRNFEEQLLELTQRMNNGFASTIAAVSLTAVRRRDKNRQYDAVLRSSLILQRRRQGDVRILRQNGKPLHTFPDHALVSRGAALLSSSIEIHRPRNAGRS